MQLVASYIDDRGVLRESTIPCTEDIVVVCDRTTLSCELFISRADVLRNFVGETEMPCS